MTYISYFHFSGEYVHTGVSCHTDLSLVVPRPTFKLGRGDYEIPGPPFVRPGPYLGNRFMDFDHI